MPNAPKMFMIRVFRKRAMAVVPLSLLVCRILMWWRPADNTLFSQPSVLGADEQKHGHSVVADKVLRVCAAGNTGVTE
jgi:hypothetical protein